MQIFSLLEITRDIQHTLSEQFPQSFWIRAEMNKLNFYPQSGHCYPELLEKKEGKIVAQMKATLWNDEYQRINANFLEILHEPLKNGINILFQARVNFDPVYGLSLRILDIDPSWSLGELEREKQAAIGRLKKEGIFSRNKELQLPLLPRRIAVISVETSKGFADFLQVTGRNPWGYCFFHMMFPSILQGDKVAESMIQQLGQIEKVKDHFDVVAIIRGGGGDVGLSGYNHYELAKRIALFPLPVITGIGHATNETVTEMVAFKNCITPTELGSFLIQQFHNFLVPVQEAHRRINDAAILKISSSNKALDQTASRFLAHTGFYLRNAWQNLDDCSGILGKKSKAWIDHSMGSIMIWQSKLALLAIGVVKNQWKEVEIRARQVSILDPKNVLARGFSITMNKGKAVRSRMDVKPGDQLQTILYDGTISSSVTSVQKE